MAAPRLSRQQRRKIRRDCLERGRKILQRGLGAELAEDDALGLALILHDVLLDPTLPRRAVEAAALAEDLLDKSLVTIVRGMELGCHKGCNYCCDSLVTCTPPEIFRVAHWLRDNAGGAAASLDLTAVTAEAQRRHGLTGTSLFLNRAPCPLLVSRACGVYAVRPIPCRALLSLSSEACRIALREDKGQVPVVSAAMDKGEMVRTLLLAAVNAAGLPDRGVELNAGIMAVIGKPDAETRWLAGENVFEGVLGADRLPSARGAQDHISRLIRALAD